MSLKTPKAILSFPALFEPKKGMKGSANAKMKYGCTLIFPAGTDLTELKAAATAVGEEKFGKENFAKLMKKVPTGFKWPFRSGSEREEHGFPADSIFIGVNSDRKPGVVSRFGTKDPVTGRLVPDVIEDPDEMYPGCWVIASVNPFAFDNESKGVAFGLNNIQKIAEGDRIDNRRSATDEFDAVEADPVELSL